jgi:hypothetical protein
MAAIPSATVAIVGGILPKGQNARAVMQIIINAVTYAAFKYIIAGGREIITEAIIAVGLFCRWTKNRVAHMPQQTYINVPAMFINPMEERRYYRLGYICIERHICLNQFIYIAKSNKWRKRKAYINRAFNAHFFARLFVY